LDFLALLLKPAVSETEIRLSIKLGSVGLMAGNVFLESGLRHCVRIHWSYNAQV